MNNHSNKQPTTPPTSSKSVGIFSPSSSIIPERFEKGVELLRANCHSVTIHPQTYNGMTSGTQFAGTIDEKASAFMDLWGNPEIDVIMASCGGNFSSQFLHLVDFSLVAKTPKPLIGFSDTTALLSAIYAKTGIGGIFGPSVQTLGRVQNHDNVLSRLFGYDTSPIPISSAGKQTSVEKSPVFAATFSVLMSLVGTPYFPDLSGHILILEDIGEELSHLDRMLWQLNEVCPLRNLKALVFGEFVDLKDTGRPLGLTFDDMILKFGTSQGIPVFKNAPIGHDSQFLPIPLGQKASIEGNNTPHLIFETN